MFSHSLSISHSLTFLAIQYLLLTIQCLQMVPTSNLCWSVNNCYTHTHLPPFHLNLFTFFSFFFSIPFCLGWIFFFLFMKERRTLWTTEYKKKTCRINFKYRLVRMIIFSSTHTHLVVIVNRETARMQQLLPSWHLKL